MMAFRRLLNASSRAMPREFIHDQTPKAIASHTSTLDTFCYSTPLRFFFLFIIRKAMYIYFFFIIVAWTIMHTWEFYARYMTYCVSRMSKALFFFSIGSSVNCYAVIKVCEYTLCADVMCIRMLHTWRIFFSSLMANFRDDYVFYFFLVNWKINLLRYINYEQNLDR